MSPVTIIFFSQTSTVVHQSILQVYGNSHSQFFFHQYINIIHITLANTLLLLLLKIDIVRRLSMYAALCSTLTKINQSSKKLRPTDTPRIVEVLHQSQITKARIGASVMHNLLVMHL